MAHKRLTGEAAPAMSTLFDGTMIELGWDGRRDPATSENIQLPSADFAIYLINAVKFHIGQLFHLFDEATFMPEFSHFYENVANQQTPPPLWYVHFLTLLAFGKVFVARTVDGRRLPGAEFFERARMLMPDIIFLNNQPVEAVEVLCCQALYLQSLDFRTAAHNVVGHFSPLIDSYSLPYRLAKP